MRGGLPRRLHTGQGIRRIRSDRAVGVTRAVLLSASAGGEDARGVPLGTHAAARVAQVAAGRHPTHARCGAGADTRRPSGRPEEGESIRGWLVKAARGV